MTLIKSREISKMTKTKKHLVGVQGYSRRDFIIASSVQLGGLVGLLGGIDFARGADKQEGQSSYKFGLGVWSHKLRDFADKDEVAKHVKRLAEAGVDILIPIVKFPSGTVDFMTSVAEVHPKYPDWDPLQVLIANCRDRGVKVHPWLCVFPEGEHSRLLREHPEFAVRGVKSRQRWACAMRSQVQDYEFELYKSVAVGYRPDGLHLDYIRTGGVCRCEFCRAEMNKQGIDISKVKPSEPKWVQWRSSRLTGFVRRLRKFTKDKKMELSAAVFRNYESARIFQAQDWLSWANQRLVDYLMPMSYTNDVKSFAQWAKSHVALVRGRVPVWEGIGKKSSASELSTEALAQQAQAAHQAGAQGVVIFHYSAITDGDFKALKEVRATAGR